MATTLTLCLTTSCARQAPQERSPTRKQPREASGTCTLGMPLPGVTRRSPTLEKRLLTAWRARSPGYRPRTRHLCANGEPRYLNRLLLEQSPYLRQHAHNPVNWFPWGDEAFARARRLRRPVLLSVGYATCHWCHVMERESFEDPAIAKLLNERYVAIKVDREELPHVDATYMSALELIKRSGGWPLTVWLLPDRRPFYATSYLPPRDGDRGASQGFVSWLERLARAYNNDAAAVGRVAAKLAGGVRVLLSPPPAKKGDKANKGRKTLPTMAIHDTLAATYKRRFDSTYGGLRGAPKFPSSPSIPFLLRQSRRRPKGDALRQARLTLRHMAAGGLFDHLGGGFHRYSTDARWRVPHFEKMLYDNALLTIAYLEGAQACGEASFNTVARRTLDYVLRELRSPSGAFYAATDADSAAPKDPDGERSEGRFFTWTPREVQRALGPLGSPIFSARYGIREAGDLEGRSVLHLARGLPALAVAQKQTVHALKRELARLRGMLYRARAKRPPPLRDEKIITGWNGLMIAALARAGLVLSEPRYYRAAARAGEVLWLRLRLPNGRLARRLAGGTARFIGALDDHAYTLWALIELFEASGELRWLKRALALEAVIARGFEDPKGGAFFSTAKGDDALLGRQKPYRDSARPAANGVHALNLLRLYQLTDRQALRRRAGKTLRAFQRVLRESPEASPSLVLAHGFASSSPLQIVLLRLDGAPDAAGKALRETLRKTFVPYRVMVDVPASQVSKMRPLLPLLEGKRPLGGKSTAFVCCGGSCKRPTSDAAVFAKQLQGSCGRKR